MHGLQRRHGARLSDHRSLNNAHNESRRRSGRRLSHVLGPSVAGAALAALLHGAVVAHDGSSTSLQIPVEWIPPGSSMPIVGLDFFPGERLRVVLVDATGTSIALGSVQARADGHFESSLDVPTGVAEGLASVDAISESGIIVRALVTIDLAAAPASYRPVFPTAVDETPAPAIDVVPLIAGGLAVLALATLAVRTRPSTRGR